MRLRVARHVIEIDRNALCCRYNLLNGRSRTPVTTKDTLSALEVAELKTIGYLRILLLECAQLVVQRLKRMRLCQSRQATRLLALGRLGTIERARELVSCRLNFPFERFKQA